MGRSLLGGLGNNLSSVQCGSQQMTLFNFLSQVSELVAFTKNKFSVGGLGGANLVLMFG